MYSALFVQKVWTLRTRALHDPHAKCPKVADRWWMEVGTYPSHFGFPPQIETAKYKEVHIGTSQQVLRYRFIWKALLSTFHPFSKFFTVGGHVLGV